MRHVEFTNHLAGATFPRDAAIELDYATSAWARAGGDESTMAAGIRRQIQAIQLSGDRTHALARITAPTLVLHGDHDPIVASSGRAATAAAITGARLVTIEGAITCRLGSLGD